jgi:hypothetical protein
VRAGDEFCEACGEKVPKELKNTLGEQGAAAEWTMATHGKKAESTQKTIGGLAILFVLGGVVFFFVTRSQVETALGELGGAADTQPLVHAVGAANTVGELRAYLEHQPWQVLGLNLFLAAIMAGLWQWSKRALLPAAITALALYVAVIVMSAIYDPSSLASGLVLKIIIVVALANGVRSAAAVRRLELAR